MDKEFEEELMHNLRRMMYALERISDVLEYFKDKVIKEELEKHERH